MFIIFNLLLLITTIIYGQLFDNANHDFLLQNNYEQCETSHELPTFIRISKVKSDSPVKLRKRLISLSACVDTCRLNNNNNERIKCSGFGVIGTGSEKQCEFYENENNDEAPLRPLRNTESKSTYFEKLCLAIPDHCDDAPFSFELSKNKSLFITPIESIIVDDRKRCLNFCLSNPNCKSVNYNQHTGQCQIMDKTCRSIVGGLTDLIGSEHYENTCSQEVNRCLPGQRVDFIVTKDSRINGLDISLGPSSLKSCMRSCVDSTVMFCRSFSYNYITTECIINEESSELSILSPDYTLFEPICLSSQIDIPCTGDYVFERIPNYNLVAEGFIKYMKGPKIDYCIDDCLLDDACITVVYEKDSKMCKLYSVNRKDDMTKIVMDLTTDLYELACSRQKVFKDPISTTKRRDLYSFTRPIITTTVSLPSLEIEDTNDPCGSKLLEHGRTLRLDYRSLHHVNVKTFEQCRELCASATINCATFAFNQRTYDCLLSTTVVNKDKMFEVLTQPSPDYSIYSFMGYGSNNDRNCKSAVESGKRWWDDMNGPSSTSTTTKFVFVTTPTITTTPIYAETALKETSYTSSYSTTALLKLNTTVHTSEDIPAFEFEGNFLDITQDVTPKSDDTVIDENQPTFETSNVFIPDKVLTKTTTTTMAPTTTSTIESTTSRERETFNPRTSTTISSVAVTSKTSDIPTFRTFPKHGQKINQEMIDKFNQRKKFFDSNEVPESSSDDDNNSQLFTVNSQEPPRKLIQHDNIRQFLSDDINVKAMCIENGVNISFSTNNHHRYTGAVYAAERFSQCKVLIDNKDDFSIFINRPSINNFCNALETDNIFTVILVLSNDLVLPFDVTTKDDFFYQVTCNYNEMSEGTLVRTGIVVGGPEPKSVMSTIHRDEQNTKVLFRILKNSQPVSNVFMGEQLTAIVQSDVEASRMKVTECNATRVGGREPRPNSVQLIADGCSLMPQVISDMRPGPLGLEASLTAFRIDGSDQIDIACNVLICRKNCEKRDTCDKVVERHRRTAALSAPSPVRISSATNDDLVTVDQRLRVLVEDDSSSSSSTGTIKGTCLDPTILLILVVLLLLSLSSLFISMFANKLRRKRYPTTSIFNRTNGLPRLERCNI